MAPRATSEKGYKTQLNMCYEFSVPGNTANVRLVTLVPRTMQDRQRILGVSWSEKPLRVFVKDGSCYAEFMFAEPKKRFEVEINIEAKLFRYDLSTARNSQRQRFSEEPSLNTFLRQEKYIEKDHPQIQQIAESLLGRDEMATVKNVYSYVLENLEYAGRSKKDLGALKAAQKKRGDCSEYADLFVALCRALDIPARVITGYAMRPDDVAPKHHWVEVYLQEYGWVPFDPSRGDLQGAAARTRAFETLSPVYVYLSHIRNDEVLHNGHFYFFGYWGDKLSLKERIEFEPVVSHNKTRR
jgi:transglutaminase-like putative cysteine protease